ncbi:hypothetical protein AKO1_014600 [Acrasis kona]|uniref:Uncharacterized protein n=1 Tax=Acrasis kona TaxID=1008807 RepID=A0AAW2Z1Y2_9EUKA
MNPFDDSHYDQVVEPKQFDNQAGFVEYQSVAPTSYVYEGGDTQLPVQFYQNDMTSEDLPEIRRFSNLEPNQVVPEPKKRQHFHVDSFYDNIPVVSDGTSEPIGDIDDFFNEFHRKTSLSDDFHSNPKVNKETELQSHLQRLNSLGFTDETKNRNLLDSYDSDMDKVIKHYLDLERLKYKIDQKEKEKVKTTPVVTTTAPADEIKFEIRVGDLKNLTYTVSILDASGNLAYKAVLLLHSCIIIKDKNNQTISRIVKDDLHIHPTYSISRSGRKVARCKERFKLSLERKFNYYAFAGEVIKMSGMYGKDWIFKKSGGVVGSLTNKGRKTFELKTKQPFLVQSLSLCMIMLERRYTSMRAVVVV